MDISTLIVDMLRKNKDEAALNAGGPIAKPAPLTSLIAGPEAEAAGRQLGNPQYAMYRREALASGEPVMSPDEFARAQSEGRY